MAGEFSIIHIKWDQRMPKVSPPLGHFSLALGGILWAPGSAVCHILSPQTSPSLSTLTLTGGRAGAGGMGL